MIGTLRIKGKGHTSRREVTLSKLYWLPSEKESNLKRKTNALGCVWGRMWGRGGGLFFFFFFFFFFCVFVRENSFPEGAWRSGNQTGSHKRWLPCKNGGTSTKYILSHNVLSFLVIQPFLRLCFTVHGGASSNKGSTVWVFIYLLTTESFLVSSSRKHAFIILIPLNHTFI